MMAEIGEIIAAINTAISPIQKSVTSIEESVKKIDDRSIITMTEGTKNTTEIENIKKQRDDDIESAKEKDEVAHKRITKNEEKNEAFRKWVYLTMIGAAGTIIVLFVTFFLK